MTASTTPDFPPRESEGDPGLPSYLCQVCGKRRDRHLNSLLCAQQEASASIWLNQSWAAVDMGDAVKADWAMRRASIYSTLALSQEVRRLEATLTAIAREFYPHLNGRH